MSSPLLPNYLKRTVALILHTGYKLSTTTRKVDDTVLDPFTITSYSLSHLITDLPSPLTGESCIDGYYTAIGTNSRKRLNPYINDATPCGDSKRIKDDGCGHYGGEVVTSLPLQSGNLLSPPIAVASNSPSLNYGQVWLDILEEPEEVNYNWSMTSNI